MAWLGAALRVLVGDRGPRRPRATSAQRPPRPRDRTADATGSPRNAESPERSALLAEAMRIHRSKRRLLDRLGDEDRFLLRVLAHQLLVEDRTMPPGAPPRPVDPGTAETAPTREAELPPRHRRPVR